MACFISETNFCNCRLFVSLYGDGMLFFVSASVYIDGGQKISEFVENQSIYEQPGL